MKLPKPLLVLTSRPLAESTTDADEKKRRRGDDHDAGSKRQRAQKEGDSSAAVAAVASDSSATIASASAPVASLFPSSCLQTVALIRQKYVFAQRPFAICESSTADGAEGTSKKKEASTTSASGKAH